MRPNLTLKIKRRSQPEWLVWLLIMMPFAFGTLFELLPFPSAMKYLLDVAYVLLLLFMGIKQSKIRGELKRFRLLVIWIVTFIAASLVLYVINYQSAVYYIWGLRNNFRFYAAFFAFSVFIKFEDIESFLAIFDKLFWVNVVVSLVQFFMLGYTDDRLGGLFGVTVGANAYTNNFFVIVAVRSIVGYLNKREPLWLLLAKMVAALIIAALAEIKFFYLEFILILVAATFLTGFTWRKFLAVIGGLAVVGVGYAVLVTVFPRSGGFLSVDGVLDIAAAEDGYTSKGDVNRLTAISIISQRFLTTFPERLFGMGLGNCDTASFSFLVTPFYERYSYLRYHWFSEAFMFLEMGYLGLIFFNGFFVIVFLQSIGRKAVTTQERIYRQMAAIVAICCVPIGVYNASLRMEAGYMMYFILALPYISAKGARQEKNPNEITSGR